MMTNRFFKMNIAPLLKTATAFLCTVFILQPAHALFSVVDTGTLVAPGSYQATFEPQFILSRYSGLNVVGRLDTGLNESSSVRGIIGVGIIDFEFGGFYKYIPFPDTETQPAIGGEIGVIYGRVNRSNILSIRFNPLVSKSFGSDIGKITGYGSVPFGITSWENESTVPVQLVAGAELVPTNLKYMSFFTEVGLNVANAFNYVSFAVSYRFDEINLKHR